MELVATFYAPGTVEQVARTIEGFGRGEAVVAVDAPSGPRLDLLAAGLAAARRARAARGPLRAHARLRRAALPPRPAALPGPARRPGAAGLGAVDRRRLRAVRRAGRARPLPARAGGRRRIEPVGGAALRFGRLCETYPDAIFCALLGHRPSPKRTPWGLQQRIAALRMKGVHDADGGLWHRTLDELDACAAAYAAYALAAGLGLWVGAPEEGVIVLPVPSCATATRSSRRRRARTRVRTAGSTAARRRGRPTTYTGGAADGRTRRFSGARPSPVRATTPCTHDRTPAAAARSSARSCVGALPEGDLAELKELLRTAPASRSSAS